MRLVALFLLYFSDAVSAESWNNEFFNISLPDRLKIEKEDSPNRFLAYSKTFICGYPDELIMIEVSKGSELKSILDEWNKPQEGSSNPKFKATRCGAECSLYIAERTKRKGGEVINYYYDLIKINDRTIFSIYSTKTSKMQSLVRDRKFMESIREQIIRSNN
jgi:hypothetical protein